MAIQLSEIQSLPFHQIIGAPLLAIVEGQAQASQATAEFIERVGFDQKEGESGDIGNLRMITFSYKKADINGELKTFRLEIPLLSIIPIPSIEIKEAEMEFNVKISDIQTTRVQSQFGDDNAVSGDWLSKDRVEFRAAMGSMDQSRSSNTDVQMNVKLKLERADITTGLQQLFRVMDQAVNSKENT